MKKTLVAIAALAAVGAVSAQSSVTLYGRIDASVGSSKTEVGGVTTADPSTLVRSGGHTGSRWGLKGTEDLGGGLKANFVLEQGFNVDDGTASSSARQFHRQAYVGLSGGWGSFNIGRQYDITDNMYGLYDAFGYSGYSAMGYAFNEGCTTVIRNLRNTGSGDCIGRQDNALMYTTPKMGGFSVTAMWAPGEDKVIATPTQPGQGAGRAYGIMANYANGPIAAGLGYQSNRAGGQRDDRNDLTFGASYDLGAAKLFLQLERGENNNTPGTGKDTGFQIGATVPFGAATLVASYAAEKHDIAGNEEFKARAIGLMGRYDLSKRTYVYAAYRRGETDPTGNPAMDRKVTTYGLGVVHNF